MEKKIYSGYLTQEEDYNRSDLLLCGSFGDGFFSDLQGDCEKYGNFVNLSYYISKRPFNLTDVDKYLIEQYFGIADVDIIQVGCPTCCLMGLDKGNIGGHDLYAELSSHIGKYCILEVDFYKNEEEFKENLTER